MALLVLVLVADDVVLPQRAQAGTLCDDAHASGAASRSVTLPLSLALLLPSLASRNSHSSSLDLTSFHVRILARRLAEVVEDTESVVVEVVSVNDLEQNQTNLVTESGLMWFLGIAGSMPGGRRGQRNGGAGAGAAGAAAATGADGTAGTAATAGDAHRACGGGGRRRQACNLEREELNKG